MMQTKEPVLALEALKAKRKFAEDMPALYPGAFDEATRTRCETRVNGLLDTLIQGAPQSLSPDRVLAQLRQFLPAFDGEDTEERERACRYCEEIMDILGMESSEGVLSTWLYGFDPNQPR